MKLVSVGAVFVLLAGGLVAHSLFLKLDTYFLEPHTKVTVPLLNGEFSRSENAIARDRMLDVSVVGPEAEVMHPPKSAWRDDGVTTFLDMETGPPGTYTIGVSTASRVIELGASEFNSYLEHDGILDTLERRKRDGAMGKDARERYAKHVKAIVQVGKERSDGYAARLGYPIEIVPLQNPYDLTVGDALDVLVLKDGKPLPNQRVYGNHEHQHDHDESGGHIEACATRTDGDGRATITLDHAGRWYVRLINMVEREEPKLDYASEWATMTFEIRQRDVSVASEEGLPWAWIGGGILVTVLLLFGLRMRG